jgi:hypothetical protein
MTPPRHRPPPPDSAVVVRAEFAPLSQCLRPQVPGFRPTKCRRLNALSLFATPLDLVSLWRGWGGGDDPGNRRATPWNLVSLCDADSCASPPRRNRCVACTMTAVRLNHLAPRLLAEIAASHCEIAASHCARCKRTCGVPLVRPLRILFILCQMSECQLVS